MLPEPTFLSPRSRAFARTRGRVGLMFILALSFLAGMTDAISFTAGGDFVSFMSGNTTRLASSVSLDNWHTAAHIGALILAFVIGNALGVILATITRRRSWPLLSTIGMALILAAQVQGLPGLAIAALSMGMINAVVEEINGLAIGLTFVSGALSRFGRGAGRWLMGKRLNGWRVQLIPWLGMLTGAVLGAYTGHAVGLKGLFFAGLLSLAIGGLSMLIPRQWQATFMHK